MQIDEVTVQAMSWIDWLMVAVPLVAVIVIGVMAQRFVKSVADFLAAGRKAGRYLLTVADGTAGMGLISIVAMFEMQYKSGWALSFWSNITVLISLAMTLTGFVIYRYRETRAMTMAQFFEMRYSRGFRIFSGSLAFISGIVNYALFPAVGARFIIYYCGLPHYFQLGSLTMDTFGFLMAVFLGVALFIVLLGGQITTMVTDCAQGIYSYSAYAIIVIFILFAFSFADIQEAVLNRPMGESFFNPFNIDKLQEFNLLYIFIGMFGAVYTRSAWLGSQGYMASAINPHEQKMAGVLASWRIGFTTLMVMMLVIAAYTWMNAPGYADKAAEVTLEINSRINMDTLQTTETLRTQMLVPVALRNILPVGITGIFCALMIFMMVSTDTTYMHSWGTIFIQDVVLPIYNRPIQPLTQMWLLRFSIAFIAVFAWCFSFFWGQIDFIMMFFAMTGTIYLSGAGSVIIGGLYWRKGTTAGAFTAMGIGLIFGAGGFLLQKQWETNIYPYLLEFYPNLLESFRATLESWGQTIKIVNWDVSAEGFARKFPITSQEIWMLGMLFSIAGYVGLSYLTCRKPFNLDKMLHRGKYNLEHFVSQSADQEVVEAEQNKRFTWKSLIGITEEYSKGDRILAWSVFIWTMYNFLAFLFQLIWNVGFGVWSEETWFMVWKWYSLPQAILVGIITTVWFTWGGTRDMIRLFKALMAGDDTVQDASDDGQVHERIEAEES